MMGARAVWAGGPAGAQLDFRKVRRQNAAADREIISASLTQIDDWWPVVPIPRIVLALRLGRRDPFLNQGGNLPRRKLLVPRRSELLTCASTAPEQSQCYAGPVFLNRAAQKLSEPCATEVLFRPLQNPFLGARLSNRSCRP